MATATGATGLGLNSALFRLPMTRTWEELDHPSTGTSPTNLWMNTVDATEQTTDELHKIYTYTELHRNVTYPAVHSNAGTVDWEAATCMIDLLRVLFGPDFVDANSPLHGTFTDGEKTNFLTALPQDLPFGTLTEEEHYTLTGFTLWVCLTGTELATLVRNGTLTTTAPNFNFAFTARASYLWALKHQWTLRDSPMARTYRTDDSLNLVAFRMDLTTLTMGLLNGTMWMWNRHYLDYSLVYSTVNYALTQAEARSARLFRLTRYNVGQALYHLETDCCGTTSRFQLDDYVPLTREFFTAVEKVTETSNRQTRTVTFEETGATGSGVPDTPTVTGAQGDALEQAQLGALQQEQLIVLGGNLGRTAAATRTEDFLYMHNLITPATASSSSATPTPTFRAITTSPWQTAPLVKAAPTATERTEAATMPLTPLGHEDERQTGTGTD